MSSARTATPSYQLRVSLSLATLFLLICAGGGSARAQTAETLSQVKKIFVESFGQEESANKVRERIIKQLHKNPRLEVVEAAKEADAVIKGTESVWVAGYYSNSGRVPSNARQPILHGYLSAEVIGKNNETLWSYLVTPSKFRSGPITDDLADQFVTKFDGAIAQKSEKVVSSIAERNAETTLNGAGATFPAPLYQKWFESFQQRDPNVHITYAVVGSEAGLQMLRAGKVDFAASDVPLSTEKSSEAERSLLQFATVVGAVVPIYNLKGVERSLNFTGEVLADIYLGKIKKWNDPKIRKGNRNASLPDSEIVVVHRSDGSGTTFAWTDYLSKVSSEWKNALGAGSTVNWPAGTGAEGNQAVAAAVQQTPNSIGYVELVYALRHQLSFGAVQNASGDFVQADLASVTSAARGAGAAMTSDFRVSIANAPGRDAYPIATFTWWVLPETLGGVEKKNVFLDLLQWMLTSGQKECSAFGYAPLPREIVTRELQFLSKLK
jgi:phosphate transport system substrate-binding protein